MRSMHVDFKLSNSLITHCCKLNCLILLETSQSGTRAISVEVICRWLGDNTQETPGQIWESSAVPRATNRQGLLQHTVTMSKRCGKVSALSEISVFIIHVHTLRVIFDKFSLKIPCLTYYVIFFSNVFQKSSSEPIFTKLFGGWE